MVMIITIIMFPWRHCEDDTERDYYFCRNNTPGPKSSHADLCMGAYMFWGDPFLGHCVPFMCISAAKW